MLNVSIVNLNVSKGFTGDSYGVTIWSKAVPSPYSLGSVCTTRLTSVIVHQDSTEQGLAGPDFEALEDCICRGVPVPFGMVFM